MEPPSSGRVCVINQSGIEVPTVLLERAAESALASKPQFIGPVSILLTSDESVRELNKRYRNTDEPTDVLSFPAVPLCKISEMIWPLGDVAISVPYAARQAKLRNSPLEVELQYLAIHGVLHLLGWNDEDPGEQALMQAEMARIGRQLGLPEEPRWVSVLHGGSS